MKTDLSAACAAIALIVSCNATQAQKFPDRPIRIIVPIAPGSVTDVIMFAANELGPEIGQQVVIENRPGANFVIGAQACAAAVPDGYTLCVVNNNSLSINPLIYNKLPYDAQNDFSPITNLFLLVEAFAVCSIAGCKQLRRRIACDGAQQARGAEFRHPGSGSYPDLFGLAEPQMGSKLVGIPYRGGGPVALAIAANEIQMVSMASEISSGLQETRS